MSKDLTVTDLFQMVGNFHHSFEEKEYNVHGIPLEQIKLRFDLGKEEMQETDDALIQRDVVEAFDGMIDQLFILVGTMRKAGFNSRQVARGFEEVFRSNMSKLQDGKVIRREDGKILKGEGYFKPSLKEIIEKN
jgi:predicted HAD superfamily Cof-like phosphohydrolase